MKVKRVIALVLALTMMFALVAMTASAAKVDTPTIIPKATCVRCGCSYFNNVFSMENPPDSEYYTTCQYKGITHVHQIGDVYLYTYCASCKALVHSGYAGKGEKCTYNNLVWK